MKKLRYAVAASLAAACTALPMYSSAAMIKIESEPAAKEASVGGFSLSAPRFSISDSIKYGKLVAAPEIRDVNADSDILEIGKTIPEYYDMRNHYPVSPVKDQGKYGTCWAHSAMASAESSVIKYNPEIDLSELHTAYYAYYGDDQVPTFSEGEDILQIGGTTYLAANLLSQWIGPVNEMRLPYENINFMDDLATVENLRYMSDYHLKNAYVFDYNKDRTDVEEVNCIIKQFIYDGLAVDVSFQSEDGKYYSEKYNSTRSERKPRFATHSVTIVGWDDNFPKENFEVPAETDGAWLVKNSWGAESYDYGYMWISYDDRSLCEFAAFELEDAEKYKYNYQHDSFVPIQSLSATDSPDTPSYMANIFMAEKPFQLEAVSMYVPQGATEYEITVYSGLTDHSDVISGTPLVAASGTVDIPGNVTIELDRDIFICNREYFSIVIKLYCEDSPYVIPIESSLYLENDDYDEKISLGTFTTYEGIKANTNNGESFYSSDGIEWFDTSTEDYIYTDEEKMEVLEQLKEELFDGIYPEETELLEEAETLYGYYETAFDMADLGITIGNVSLKALGNPVNTVDFSHMSGYIPEDEKLELSVKDGSTVYYSLNGGEYIPYTEPIEIDGYGYVSATTDNLNYTERSYISADFVLEKGDVDASGAVDASDASAVLVHYASVSTGGEGTLKKAIFDYSDFNGDLVIDSADASDILVLYAERSTK